MEALERIRRQDCQDHPVPPGSEGLPRRGRRNPGDVRWGGEAGVSALTILRGGASPRLGVRRRWRGAGTPATHALCGDAVARRSTSRGELHPATRQCSYPQAGVWLREHRASGPSDSPALHRAGCRLRGCAQSLINRALAQLTRSPECGARPARDLELEVKRVTSGRCSLRASAT
eukprot:3196015-Pyramimonas_sp.AAC.1